MPRRSGPPSHRRGRTPGRPWIGLAASALLCLAPALAPAAEDPERTWGSARQGPLLLLYEEEAAPLAERVLPSAAAALATIEDLFGWTLERELVLVLDDRGDGANGSARVLPYPVIRLNAAPPGLDSELAGPGSWLDRLVLHELVHILHLQQVGGLQALVNDSLGPQLYPNQALPSWFVEGLATWVESRRPPEGRLHQPLFRGRMRIRLLEGAPLPVDRLGTIPLEPPGANAWYMFGGAFVAWLAERHGATALRDFVEIYGDRPFPYGVNASLLEAAGVDFVESYGAFIADAAARARDEAAHRGNEGTRLGGPILSMRSLRPLTAGRALLSLEDDGHDDPAIVLRDATTGAIRWRAPCHGGCADATPTAGGQQAIVSIGTPLGPVRRHRDLYAVNLPTAGRPDPGDLRPERWTTGARLARPDASRWPALPVLAVTMRGGATAIAAVAGPGAAPRLVTPLSLEARVDMPRFASQARSYVYSEQRGTEHALILTEWDSGRRRVVARSPWPLLHPAFLPGDEALVVAAVVDGAYDLVAIPLSAGGAPLPPVRRLTRAVGAALRPAPIAGGAIACLAMRGEGWSLQAVPSRDVDGAEIEAVARGEVALPRQALARASAAPAMTALDTAPGPGPPILALLRPRAVVPEVALSASGGLDIGASVEGSDPLGHHGWSLTVSGDDLADGGVRPPDVFVAYRYGGAPFDLGVSLADADAPRGWFDGEQRRAADARIRLVSASLSRSLPGVDEGARISAGVDFVHHGGRAEPHRRDPGGEVAVPLRPNIFPAFSLALSYGSRRGNHFGTVAERGLSTRIGLRFEPRLGPDDVERWRLEWSLDTPWRVPGVDHLIVSVMLDGRLSLAPEGRRERFRVGGLGPTDLLSALLDQQIRGYSSLRGFPEGAFAGTQSQRLTLDLSSPAWPVYRGAGTFPLALRRLNAAIYTDAAWIGPYRADARDLHVGVGAELRTSIDLDWGFRPVLRAGVARGLGAAGITELYVVVGHHP